MKTRIYALTLALMLALSANTFAADEGKHSCDKNEKTHSCDKDKKDKADCCKKECDAKDHEKCKKSN